MVLFLLINEHKVLSIFDNIIHVPTGGQRKAVTVKIPKFPATFTGTGDLFAALFMAWMSRSGDLQTSIEKTISTLQAVLKRTIEHANRKSCSLLSCRFCPLLSNQWMFHSKIVLFFFLFFKVLTKWKIWYKKMSKCNVRFVDDLKFKLCWQAWLMVGLTPSVTSSYVWSKARRTSSSLVALLQSSWHEYCLVVSLGTSSACHCWCSGWQNMIVWWRWNSKGLYIKNIIHSKFKCIDIDAIYKICENRYTVYK